ncbi:four helix bundle protein [Zunongwangia sp. F363]|uniref:Four helix bundle protein n=1 Tax=Autumnicola tepida TaxID=3075595 RepID=A0ABU3C9D9_9FLAO|nr:four helix bundle protein [Zunongwangia sp. F363]MDT0642941.1 four helix bundle protein [Zunongwangia sp. F363]
MCTGSKSWKFGKRAGAFVKIFIRSLKIPEGEKFGLVNQLRRAGVSIPSNIAEGACRESAKDFSRF